MGDVVVNKKKPQQPVCASRLEPFKSYRVIEIRPSDQDKQEWAEVGDILVAIPATYIVTEVFNTRTKKLMHKNTGFLDRVICVRDFTVESVTLTFDDNELPA